MKTLTKEILSDIWPIILGLGIGILILITAIKFNRESKAIKNNCIGKEIVIYKDTLQIVNYTPFGNTLILSNGLNVDYTSFKNKITK